MNKTTSLVSCAVGLSLLTGCSIVKPSSAAVGRDYDFDALNAYMTDAPFSIRPVGHTVGEFAEGQQAGPAVTYQGFYGHWVAKIDMEEEMKKEAAKRNHDPSSDPEMEKAGEEFAKAMVGALSAMMTMELDIEKDGAFKMTMMGMPMEGKWTKNAQLLSLVPEKFMGMSADDFAKQQGQPVSKSEPLDLQISADGKTLTAREPDSRDPQVIVFKREGA